MNRDRQTRVKAALEQGLVIPAHPLALDAKRKLDERRQRALTRYYLAAGAGGLAIGVHTTQFEIRNRNVGLLRPVLELGSEEALRFEGERNSTVVRIAGICGDTGQAVQEAALASDLGYDVGLVSLGAMPEAGETTLVQHCQEIGRVIPLMGFYLQPAVGGRVLPYSFWRSFAEIPQVVAIKLAPFNRYQTLDVVRAVVDSNRDDIALYTGNDDNIVVDLLTPYRFTRAGGVVQRRIVGGLLGQWAVWTSNAVQLVRQSHELTGQGESIPLTMLTRNAELTDANAAIFDAANRFAGCIPGIHEVLRQQGLLEGTWCIDPNEVLSPGQREEIDRVCEAYPHLRDDAFVAEHRDDWLRP